MITKSRLVLLFSAACLPPVAVGQGTLTPPGPPGPTMKTLTEIEPRTPVSSLPFTISAPGSYYLTGNLNGVPGADGITVNVSGVTLDLNGFTIASTGGANASGNAIV